MVGAEYFAEGRTPSLCHCSGKLCDRDFAVAELRAGQMKDQFAAVIIEKSGVDTLLDRGEAWLPIGAGLHDQEKAAAGRIKLARGGIAKDADDFGGD